MNNKNLEYRIIKIIKKIYKKKKIELHPPFFFFIDLDSARNSLNKKQISTYGNITEKFEKKIKEITKAKYVIAVNSGTSALHLAIIAAGIKKNQEILVPSLNFIASTNAIIYNNSIPHFIETDFELGIDCKKLDEYLSKTTYLKKKTCYNKSTKREVKAIIPTHVFGHIGDMDSLKKISKKYNLIIIEDASEALGSYYKEKHAGTFGLVGVLSFNGNKIITTGAGGAVLTNSKKLAEKVRFFSTTSKKFKNYYTFHDEVGYNYRMPSLNAALGIAQLSKFNFIKKNKKTLHQNYKTSFVKMSKNLKFITSPKNSSSNFWLNAIKLNNSNLKKILEISKKNQIQIRPMWSLVSNGKKYKNFPRMKLNISKKLSNSILCIPSGVTQK